MYSENRGGGDPAGTARDSTSQAIAPGLFQAHV
ncbi:hypothetical protein BSFP_030010 [Burkholderia stabilis]|uniref:Uncharacterized protein n=1 Tax=Burkholderia stabilis TaxID=95485 RepID=A0A1Y1BPD3_9BURK|nr:hypothetical protein BSFP_030010 [Burkholderia stabilis]